MYTTQGDYLDIIYYVNTVIPTWYVCLKMLQLHQDIYSKNPRLSSGFLEKLEEF